MSAKGDGSASEHARPKRAPISSIFGSPTRSANRTLRTGVDKLLQSTKSSLRDAAKTAREKLAARQAERYAKQRAREIRELRSRIIGFSTDKNVEHVPSPAPNHEEISELKVADATPEVFGPEQLLLQPFLKQLEEFNLKVQEFEVEKVAKARAAEGRKELELALRAAKGDVAKKVRELDDLSQAKARAEEERNQTEVVLLSLKEELERKAQEVAMEQATRLKAEDERRQTEAALLRVKQDSVMKMRELETEREARLKADEERKLAEQAVVRTQKVARKKEQEASEERQARIRAEQELLHAVADRTTNNPPQALIDAEKEAVRKTEEAQAEHQARLRAEQERQQAQQELLAVGDEVKRKSRQLEQERLAKTVLERDLKLAQKELLKAEAEVEAKTNEIEAERRAKLEAEQQRQQAELSLLKLQEQTERMARESEEKEVTLKAELDRKDAEKVQVSIDSRVSTASIRTCPSCRRIFSASQELCLFDATRLVDSPAQVSPIVAGRTNVLNWPLVSLIIATFLGTGVLGVVAINYFSSLPSSAASPTAPGKRVESQYIDEPVLGGALAGKATILATPEYPAAARNRGISGKVLVAVLVDTEGTVKEARALEGAQLLRAPAEEAAKKTRFAAEKLAKQSGLASGTITYNFKLSSQP